MSDAAIVTFVDIRARDQYSAEFKKVATEGKRAAQDVGTTFKTVAKGGIADAVSEIRSLVRAYGLIKVGKFLFGLVKEWNEVIEKTAEARRQLEFYFTVRGASERLTGQFKTLAEELGKTKGLSIETAAAIVVLGDRFGMSVDRTREMASASRELAKTFPGFKGDAVAAFDAIASAEQGFFDKIQKGTNLEIDSKQRLIALLKQQQAAELELKAAQVIVPFESGLDLLNPFGGKDADRAAALRVQIAAMKAFAAQLRQEAGSIPALDPLRGEKSAEDQRRLNEGLEDYNELLRETQAEERELAKQRKENDRDQQQQIDMIQQAAQDLGAAMGDAFAATVTGAKSAKEAWADFGRHVIQIISRLIGELVGLAIFQAIVGMGTTTGNGYRSSLGKEPVPGGGGGRIIPSGLPGPGGGGPMSLPGMLGGGGGGGTINIYAMDSQDVRRALTKEQRHLGKLTMDTQQRSRSFRRVFGNKAR